MDWWYRVGDWLGRLAGGLAHWVLLAGFAVLVLLAAWLVLLMVDYELAGSIGRWLGRAG